MVVCSKAACQVCLPEALFARPTHLRWQNEKTRIHSAGVKRKRRCRLACGACSAGSQFPDCLAGGDADQKLATGWAGLPSYRPRFKHLRRRHLVGVISKPHTVAEW